MDKDKLPIYLFIVSLVVLVIALGLKAVGVG